jgi:hypothetical protein
MCGKKRMNRDGSDVGDFFRGMLVGVAAVLAIGGLVAILTNRHLTYRDAMRPKQRQENYNPGEGAIGEVPDDIGDSGSNIVDTIRSVNQALDTGRQALDTLQQVMENIRGN